MLLRTKIVLVLVPVVLGYALLDHVVQRSILRPSFDRLEAQQAKKDLERTQLAVEGEIQRISDRAEAWCQREELAAFAQGNLASYSQEYLGDPLFEIEGFGLVYILDESGQVLWGEARTAQATEHVRLSDFPRGALSPGHALLSRSETPEPTLDGHPSRGEVTYDSQATVSGLMITEGGPLLVTSHPIAPASEGSKSPGRLILGRFLDEAKITQIGELSQVNFDVWDLFEAPSVLGQDLLDQITETVTPISRAASAEEVVTYTTIDDIRRQPALIIGSRSGRSISNSGAAVVQYALLSTVAAGILMLLVLLRVLQILVLAPITRFTNQALHVAKTDDTTVRIELDRADEIGLLSKEFDSMLAKLAASRSALVESARTAGMSEIATGILHNVGNVLNSVGVAGSLVESKLQKSPIQKLDAVIGLLDQHSEDLSGFIDNDPRGKQLLPVLTSLHKLLDNDRIESLEEIRTLNSGLEHIRGLVASQQEFARRSEVREILRIEDIVNEALMICERSGTMTPRVLIKHEIEPLAAFPIDRHKSLEILVNLLGNASQSIQSADPEEPRIRIEVQALNEQTARVSITDNGVGIPAENLQRIFNHGFTTKPEGHGFGLHSAANSASEMQCSLQVESPGPGQGATFHLDMPRVMQTEPNQAA